MTQGAKHEAISKKYLFVIPTTHIVIPATFSVIPAEAGIQGHCRFDRHDEF
jgi:hypothetical protein